MQGRGVSSFSSLLHFTLDIYPYNAECLSKQLQVPFFAFGITRPGNELRSPRLSSIFLTAQKYLNLSVSRYRYNYLSLNTHTHTHTYIYIYIYIYMCVCVCVCVCVWCVCACVSLCVSVSVSVWTRFQY